MEGCGLCVPTLDLSPEAGGLSAAGTAYPVPEESLGTMCRMRRLLARDPSGVYLQLPGTVCSAFMARALCWPQLVGPKSTPLGTQEALTHRGPCCAVRLFPRVGGGFGKRRGPQLGVGEAQGRASPGLLLIIPRGQGTGCRVPCGQLWPRGQGPLMGKAEFLLGVGLANPPPHTGTQQSRVLGCRKT